MKLVIVAATGGIGKHLLRQAREAGHEVVAVVRDPAKLPEGVTAVQADLMRPDPQVLAAAIDGADAVLSGLGPAFKAGIGVAATGTRGVIDAMRLTDVKRLVVVSAAPIGTVPSPARPNPPKRDPGDSLPIHILSTLVIKRVFAANYADLAEMEDALRDSGLQWTAVRPSRLTDKPASGEYRTALDRNVRGGSTVSRANVADCMLRLLERPDTIGHTVAVAD